MQTKEEEKKTTFPCRYKLPSNFFDPDIFWLQTLMSCLISLDKYDFIYPKHATIDLPVTIKLDLSSF